MDIKTDLKIAQRIQTKAWITNQIAENGQLALARHMRDQHDKELTTKQLLDILYLVVSHLPEEMIIQVEERLQAENERLAF